MTERCKCIFDNQKLIDLAIAKGVFKDGKDPHPCWGKKTKHHIQARREGGNGEIKMTDCNGRERLCRNTVYVCQGHHKMINELESRMSTDQDGNTEHVFSPANGIYKTEALGTLKDLTRFSSKQNGNGKYQ